MKKNFILPIAITLFSVNMPLRTFAGDPPLITPLPSSWTYQPIHEQLLPEDDNWWERFNDTLLDSLISGAASANYNLLEASHRREAARLAIRQAQSAYWPTLTAGASYTRARTAGVNSNSWSLGAQMSWEVDLFGRITAQVRSKKAAYRASRAEYTAAMVSMAAELATYYIDYRLLQAQIAIANEHLVSQEKVLKIAEARHEAGLVSKLDVAQAKGVYLSTQATIPSLQSSLRSTLTSIATLLGVYPDSIAPLLETPRPLPAYEMLIPAGIPADLLRRRPDILAAEANLAESAAAVGIAKKEYLPSLTIEGEIATVTPKAEKLFGKNTLHYSIAPTLSWTIFDGLSRTYGVAQAKEQMAASIDAYNLTVMTAVGEVDNAMVSYHSAIEALEIYQQYYEQSHEALTLSIEQYKQGLSAFTNVVDAQIDLLNAANSRVSARSNAIIALIDLYRALGGSPNP
ncbi:MAG: TolC family protein [Muribaculaceae bacterium]|nr:TolC family protein [Muribaculaceae bacterium]